MGESHSQGGLRASDADRQQVVERLSAAHAEGRLTLLEFEDRSRQVWQARTYDDLAGVTADLPVPSQSVTPMAPVTSSPPAVTSSASVASPESVSCEVDASFAAARRRETAAWAAVSGVGLAVWMVIGVTVDWFFPWWLWIAGPWGIGVALKWINGPAFASGSSRRSGQAR
ncbi:hypothetical protein FHR81_002653 [Actinoalloteichus hoggarensis]|uniref:DUF1707 domain-containing protein n=1 Tax=Actinoalloteichus hoggarensis TaxID=1470176 RepID=UPI0012FD92A4|nr:DUF1707 domain-containing protein [Actinoalloteichus hoggarensis]MBB5921613.1 hypothetical protein [Actinoalloteichus hoggarensis]